MTRWGFEPSRPVVLLVDPMPMVVRALARCLRDQFEVETAGGVAEALAVAKRRKLDLVLTELVLGDGRAFALVHALREMEHRCPVVLVTTWGQEPDIAEALRDRLITAVVDKPWHNEALVAVVVQGRGVTVKNGEA